MKNMSLRSITTKSMFLQGFYWMLVCTVTSYATVILMNRQFGFDQIGSLLAIASLVSVILQPTIGAWADRSKKVTLPLILKTIAGMLLVLYVFFILSNTIWLDGLLFGAITMLTLTLQPLINALIFQYINVGVPVNFGLTRGTGSLTFAGIAFVLGQLMAHFSPTLIPFISMLIVAGLFLTVQTFPKIQHQTKKDSNAIKSKKSLGQFVKCYKAFSVFLMAATAIFLFHVLITTYLVRIIEHVGGSDADLGTALSIMAIVELPVMLAFAWLAERFKVKTLLRVAGIFFVLRSSMFVWASSVFQVNLAQVSQGLSFALFLPAAVYYVNKEMDPEDKIKGQTLMMGATTLGQVFGNLTGGWILQHFTVTAMLITGVVSATVGCVLLWLPVKDKN